MEELKSFGKYAVIATLGQGGMADVFLARVRGLEGFQKLVVIKRIRSDVADDENYRRMFLDEARLSARLHHPNVVQVFEVGEHEGDHYLAMEYLDGQPLNRILHAFRQSEERPDVGFTLRVIADALSGLHYAHELRDYDGSPLAIIHRDCTPQNVFVTYAGEVKIVDFGIAKAADGSTTTEIGVIKGKTAYLAPEQASGQQLDRRVDVFAAGVMLWEMLTGERLFLGSTPIETIQKLMSDPIPRVSDVVHEIDPHLDAICARALVRDRERRWPTAGAMRDALEDWLEQSAVRSPRRDEIGRRIRAPFAADREKLEARIHAAMRAERPSSMPPPSSSSSLETTAGAATPTHVEGTRRQADSRAPVTMVGVPPAQPALELSTTGSVRPSTAPSESAPSTLVSAVVSGVTSTSTMPSMPPPPSAPARGAPPPRSRALMTGAIAVAIAGVVGAAYLARTREAPSTTASAVGSPSVAAKPASSLLLHLCGSNTVGAELAPALVTAFLEHKGAASVRRSPGDSEGSTRIAFTLGGGERAVVIDAAGSGTAFTGLAERTCDIAMASRPIHDDEAAKLKSEGFGDMRSPSSEHVIALDGIAVVVNHSNAVKALDAEQLRGIFSGAVTDWSAVGGSAGAIHLYARDDRSGTMDTFKHLVLGERPLAPSAQRFASSEALSDAVAADTSGIGFVGLAYVRSARAAAVGDVGAEPRIASPFTVATEAYLLSRRLYLYIPDHPEKGATLDLVSFALSPEGQKVVRSQGFVDLSVTVQDPEPCPACSPHYSSLVRNARRASVDFRFREDSHELDSRGARDLDRLVRYLRDQPRARVILLGFSDAQGDGSDSLRISRERARSVAAELHARGVDAATVEGLGPERPVASNGTASGRERNRRVEVWLASEGP